MGSTRSKIEAAIKLSPREQRLVTALTEVPRWWNNEALCAVEFGDKNKWPLNARHIVSGALSSLKRKLAFHSSRAELEKRGNGGRAGIEYKLTTKGKK